jgi:geranylgeranyl diphosphate synthase type I
VLESNILLQLIQNELDDFCLARKSEFHKISPDLLPLIDFSQDLMAGGKRFRALFAYWAWAGYLQNKLNETENENALRGMVGICAALEMFHAAALVHDDLIDQSDTRRGQPAVHKRFEALHTGDSWSGLPQRFGQAGSILVGDLLLSWSSEIFGNALRFSPERTIEIECRNEFSKMRSEIMAGQYLDVVEENAGSQRNPDEAVARAIQVMTYKTAKYSIEAPMLIGAAFAGASAIDRAAIEAFAIPLGLAFQMRDDVLGVFGDPKITGKPAGDDLREGKHTVLIALTREVLTGSVRNVFDDMLTARDLNNDQITFLQQTIIGSGALQKTETQIENFGREALSALENLPIEANAKQALTELANHVMKRDK